PAFSVLSELESESGGWSAARGGASSTVVTAEVLLALLDWPNVAAAQALVPHALAALSARRNADGGYGESPSSAYATALVLQALVRAGATTTQLAPVVAWLKTHQ